MGNKVEKKASTHEKVDDRSPDELCGPHDRLMQSPEGGAAAAAGAKSCRDGNSKVAPAHHSSQQGVTGFAQRAVLCLDQRHAPGCDWCRLSPDPSEVNNFELVRFVACCSGLRCMQPMQPKGASPHLILFPIPACLRNRLDCP